MPALIARSFFCSVIAMAIFAVTITSAARLNAQTKPTDSEFCKGPNKKLYEGSGLSYCLTTIPVPYLGPWTPTTEFDERAQDLEYQHDRLEKLIKLRLLAISLVHAKIVSRTDLNKLKEFADWLCKKNSCGKVKASADPFKTPGQIALLYRISDMADDCIPKADSGVIVDAKAPSRIRTIEDSIAELFKNLSAE